MRALASHQCGLGSISPRCNIWVEFVVCSEGFRLRIGDFVNLGVRSRFSLFAPGLFSPIHNKTLPVFLRSTKWRTHSNLVVNCDSCCGVPVHESASFLCLLFAYANADTMQSCSSFDHYLI